MRTKPRELFATIHTEGGLLPSDLLARIASGEKSIPGLSPDSYHCSGERIADAINRAWNRVTAAWRGFEQAREKLAPDAPDASVTRERWLLILFQELGYGRLQSSKAPEIDGKPYPISHFWQGVPIHLVGFRTDLDTRTARVAGAARTTPHGLVQEYLNRTKEALWGFVSNGFRLRLLRDSASLTRQAYVEIDLQALMDGDVYADFALTWLLCHQSRVEAVETCWLEQWAQLARDQGTRALDTLRSGVEEAIKALGAGFLAQPANATLKERLRTGALSTQDYYRQLLRLVYRLLFLFVAEDRGVLLDPKASGVERDRYDGFYSTARLRRMAERRRGTKHPDLYRSLRLVMEKLSTDEGCAALALPPLGSFLWSSTAIPDLVACEIANLSLLDAIRALAFTTQERLLRPVDYKNLGAEELGSIYESLLELHPEIDKEAAFFDLKTASGHERKTTGSYYTPTSLIQCLLDSALDPVLDDGARKPNPEAAILALKVCDPACGSGHFLIAAAHRIARRLAAIRTGDEEPSPEAMRAAVRHVIGHCIYGVDLNPMAVELCKVSLWLDALEPGKPLSFLESRIRCGNSLLGVTPALLDAGVPDDAFQPIEGDDKAVVSALRRKNRDEREGVRSLPLVAEPAPTYSTIASTAAQLNAIGDESIADIHRKEERYRKLEDSPDYQRAKLAADAWCAAFVWKKRKGEVEAVTHDVFVSLGKDPDSVSAAVRVEVGRLAEQYQFFHWHLAFPDVFQRNGDGGFDVVLGNPPWEQVQLDPREFFAQRAPDVANAEHMAARTKAISALIWSDPALHAAFLDASRENEGVQHLVHRSGRYPLTSYGRLNSAPLFYELSRSLIKPKGRVGMIVPGGIATDAFNQFFFQALIDGRELASIHGFENEEFVFPGVHHSTKFCLLTIAGRQCPQSAADLMFFARGIRDLDDPARHFLLTASDAALVNPNTRTAPIFRTKRDAQLTMSVYRRIPVLVHEAHGEAGDPWRFQGLLMFMMNTASGLFQRNKADEEGWLPLYEAKMIHHFDHRFGTYAGQSAAQENQGKLPELTQEQHADPSWLPRPEYWVPAAEVAKRLQGRWTRGWYLGWRDICRNTDQRTVIAAIIPRVGVGHKLPLLLCNDALAPLLPALLANLTSFVLDYIARQKVGGTSLTYFYLKQLPIFSPEAYAQPAPWTAGAALVDWILPRVLELTYTAWDLEAFARDCGYDGPPFRFDPERRFHLRCELDAAFFHLYGISRDDAAHILDTFPIVRRNDEAKHGEYRTKTTILAVFDRLDAARPQASGRDPAGSGPYSGHA